MNEERARSILQVGTNADAKELFQALKRRRKKEKSEKTRAEFQAAYEYLLNNFSKTGAQSYAKSQSSPTRQRHKTSTRSGQTIKKHDREFVIENAARTLLRVSTNASTSELDAAFKAAVQDVDEIAVTFSINGYFLEAKRVLEGRQPATQSVLLQPDNDKSLMKMACAILRVSSNAANQELEYAVQKAISHPALKGNEAAKEEIINAASFLKRIPENLKTAVSRNPVEQTTSVSKRHRLAQRKSSLVNSSDRSPSEVKATVTPHHAHIPKNAKNRFMQLGGIGASLLLGLTAWWFGSSEIQSVPLEKPVFTAQTDWRGRCVNQRTDVTKWKPGSAIDVVICPGARNGVRFYSEHAPSVILRVDGSDLRVGYFRTVPCEDLFNREIVDKDIVVCRTKHWRSVGSKRDIQGIGKVWRWVLSVRETKRVTETFNGGIPFEVTTYVQNRTPKPIKRLPNNPVVEHACSEIYYRTTRCVTAYFQKGQTYNRAPPLKNADGKPNCFFIEASGKFLRKQALSNGGWRFEKIRNTGNPGASIFFELGRGEQIRSARCPL